MLIKKWQSFVYSGQYCWSLILVIQTIFFLANSYFVIDPRTVTFQSKNENPSNSFLVFKA